VGRFTTYAHNTFISYLYEFGLFGLAGLLWILISNFLMAARVRETKGLILVSCHIGVIVLNLSTMGIWTLEGAILYALLLGQTWYLHPIMERESEAPHLRGRLRLSAQRGA
jgi:membrane protein implicated in regulation of membrane protease activity